MIDIETTVKGTVLEGNTGPAIDRFLERASEAVADEGANDVRRATTIFKRPTGAYMRRIQTDRSFNSFVINDGGVIYGPWLEGTSSRNQRTRFKGYAIFRKTVQALQTKAPQIAERELPTLIRELER